MKKNSVGGAVKQIRWREHERASSHDERKPYPKTKPNLENDERIEQETKPDLPKVSAREAEKSDDSCLDKFRTRRWRV